uniref:NADH dehydrogenase subunit 4L n=1 Tax=Polymesoda caroliniana TaxID=98308 RepID=UPI002A812EE0|nr:NADH dehydrogenase subunit 4L [Polymesoda caroliniana]WOV69029.1 NADH dehydrogenase subunit 4L [Polymesoda caroliniana]
MMIVFFFMFALCLLYICINVCHFLNVLLVFEMVVVSLFLAMTYSFSLGCFSYMVYFCVVYLCLSVCESVLGLSILISVSRYGGLFQTKSFSFLGY